MALRDWFRSTPRPPLVVPPDQRMIAADAEVTRRAHALAQRMAGADAQWYYQTGPIGNSNTGLLQSQDVLVGTTPQPYIFLTDYMLAQLFADPVTRRGCSEHALSIAAAGHVVSTPEGDDFLIDIDAAHGVSKALGDCHTRANHLRAAGVLIDVDEEGDPPLWEPLDPRKVRRLRRLSTFGGFSLLVTEWQDGAEEGLPAFWRPFEQIGQPRLFQLNATFRTGAYNGPIHWTRILYMQGVALPPDVDGLLASPSSHYALSAVDLAWAAVRRYTTTTTNAERMAGSQGAWVFTVENYAALQSAAATNPAGGVGSFVSNWITSMLAAFNARKAMVGPPGFDVSAKTINLAGWEQMESGAYVQVSTAYDLPVQKLFQTLPVGLSSSPSDQWKPQFQDSLRVQYDLKWEALLVRFYTLLYYLKTGRVPQSLSVRPGPWEEPTVDQIVAQRNGTAEELKTLTEASIITTEEARTAYYPTYTPDIRLRTPQPPAVNEEMAALAKVSPVPAAEVAPTPSSEVPPINITPADIASIVTVNEARASQGLPPMDGPDGLLTVSEYQAKHAATVATAANAVAGDPVSDAASGCLVALEVAPLDALSAMVRHILPDLDAETWPHVTLLDMGATRRGDQSKIRDEAHTQSTGWPTTLQPDAIGLLGDDGAVVLFLRRAGLGAPQDRLLRAMAPYVQAPQFPRFLPHVTIGYLPRPLTDGERTRLDAVPLPESVGVRNFVLREGEGERIRWAVT